MGPTAEVPVPVAVHPPTGPPRATRASLAGITRQSGGDNARIGRVVPCAHLPYPIARGPEAECPIFQPIAPCGMSSFFCSANGRRIRRRDTTHPGACAEDAGCSWCIIFFPNMVSRTGRVEINSDRTMALTLVALEKKTKGKRPSVKKSRAERHAKELSAIAGIRLPMPLIPMQDERTALHTEADVEGAPPSTATRPELHSGGAVPTSREIHKGHPAAFVYIELTAPAGARRAHDSSTFRDDMDDCSCIMDPLEGRVRAHYPLRRFTHKLYLLVAHLDGSESLRLAWMEVATVDDDGTVKRSYDGNMSI